MQRPRSGMAPLVGIEVATFATEAGEGHGAHQLGCTGGENATHMSAAFGESAHHQRQFHSGDAAADAHQDASAPQRIAGAGSVFIKGFLIHQVHVGPG